MKDSKQAQVDRFEAGRDVAGNPDRDTDGMSPLPGEPGIPDIAAPSRPPLSKKALLAAALFTGSLIAVVVGSIQHVAAGGRKSEGSASALTRDKPAAAAPNLRRLDMPTLPTASSEAGSRAGEPRIPALTPSSDELAEPIGVRRTGVGAPASDSPRHVLPEDAPVVLVTSRPNATAASSDRTVRGDADPPNEESSTWTADRADPMTATSRSLSDYQRRLQGLLDSLTQSAAMATGQSGTPRDTGKLLDSGLAGNASTVSAPAGSPIGGPYGGGLFGGQLQGSATRKTMASMLGNRSLTLPKGTAFTCALKTKVISATSGLVGCEVQRNLYGDDGRVLLVERGSHLDGEYRIAAVKPGLVRIPILWTRIRTPHGVTVDLESPGTGQLGESGIDGYVDNRWTERIGAAMLLSLIDDSVKLVIQNQASERQGDTVVLPSTTANTSKLAEKVLDSTINIPPLIYQNQGGIVGIYVARDVDFSSVYELQPTTRDLAREATGEAAP